MTKKKYKNQFNEVKFEYDDYPTRQDYLYKNISEKYSDIVTILVANQSENTYIIEKYFAYSTHAVYWVSNGKYSPNTIVENDKIEQIRKNIDVHDIDRIIIQNIDELKYRYDNQ